MVGQWRGHRRGVHSLDSAEVERLRDLDRTPMQEDFVSQEGSGDVKGPGARLRSVERRKRGSSF